MATSYHSPCGKFQCERDQCAGEQEVRSQRTETGEGCLGQGNREKVNDYVKKGIQIVCPSRFHQKPVLKSYQFRAMLDIRYNVVQERISPDVTAQYSQASKPARKPS